ncbi:MAG: ABC transporter permease [Pseudomonadota bacterium]
MLYRWRYGVALSTLLAKEIRRFSRIWIQTLLPAATTTALYCVIFGQLIGDRIGPVGGVGYAEFIVPGLVLMAVITNAYANVVASFYSSKFQRHVEELLIAPVPDGVILAGYVAGGVARGVAVGLVVMGIALGFTDVPIVHPGLTLLVFVLTATLFSLGGFINAVYANNFDDISLVPTFVLTPLTYLGGVFYSIDMLPPFWQHLSLLNPILYMINAFRFGLLGHADINPLTALAIVFALIAGLTYWALRLLKTGVGLKT